MDDAVTAPSVVFVYACWREAPGRAPLSGSTFSLLDKQLCKTLFSFRFHGISQRMSMCTSLPSSNGATEMQFYVFEVLDFPSTSCIISSNENVLGFWKYSTLTKSVHS